MAVYAVFSCSHVCTLLPEDFLGIMINKRSANGFEENATLRKY